MSALERLWTMIASFAEALAGLDDPIGDCMLSLEKRVNKLEHDLERLERQGHSRPPCEAAPDPGNS